MAMIIAGVAGLLVAFGISLSAASRQFEHALIAQQQAVLVEGIAHDADQMNSDQMGKDLFKYHDLISQERQFLPSSQFQTQSAELRRAGELAAMAARPSDKLRLAAVIRAIAQEERSEVGQERASLHAVRRDTLALGVLLGLAAVAATVVGGVQLARANRDLAGEVMARTAELQAVDQSRRLFFAKASHELRTPVTAIRAIAEVALVGAAGGDDKGALRDIVAQTGFLGHRIEEMLALASAAEGRPSLSLLPCDMADVMAAAVVQAQPYARSLGVAIVQNLPPMPVMARADQRWLTQALLAVIDNGLKFSDPGMALELALTQAGERAIITVSDSGPGILPREAPRIFDAYYQAEAGQMRGGTGLGLALARWVAEQHGGTIHAEPREAGGCRIVIALPGEGAL